MVLYDRFKCREPTPPLYLNDITSRCTQLSDRMVIVKLEELGNGSVLPLEVAGRVANEASAKLTVAAEL